MTGFSEETKKAMIECGYPYQGFNIIENQVKHNSEEVYQNRCKIFYDHFYNFRESIYNNYFHKNKSFPSIQKNVDKFNESFKDFAFKKIEQICGVHDQNISEIINSVNNDSMYVTACLEKFKRMREENIKELSIIVYEKWFFEMCGESFKRRMNHYYLQLKDLNDDIKHIDLTESKYSDFVRVLLHNNNDENDCYPYLSDIEKILLENVKSNFAILSNQKREKKKLLEKEIDSKKELYSRCFRPSKDPAYREGFFTQHSLYQTIFYEVGMSSHPRSAILKSDIEPFIISSDVHKSKKKIIELLDEIFKGYEEERSELEKEIFTVKKCNLGADRVESDTKFSDIRDERGKGKEVVESENPIVGFSKPDTDRIESDTELSDVHDEKGKGKEVVESENPIVGFSKPDTDRIESDTEFVTEMKQLGYPVYPQPFKEFFQESYYIRHEYAHKRILKDFHSIVSKMREYTIKNAYDEFFDENQKENIFDLKQSIVSFVVNLMYERVSRLYSKEATEIQNILESDFKNEFKTFKDLKEHMIQTNKDLFYKLFYMMMFTSSVEKKIKNIIKQFIDSKKAKEVLGKGLPLTIVEREKNAQNTDLETEKRKDFVNSLRTSCYSISSEGELKKEEFEKEISKFLSLLSLEKCSWNSLLPDETCLDKGSYLFLEKCDVEEAHESLILLIKRILGEEFEKISNLSDFENELFQISSQREYLLSFPFEKNIVEVGPFEFFKITDSGK